MELYILDKYNLDILTMSNVSDYSINMDEETNGVSEFSILNVESARKGNYIVLNGLYKQFLFVINDDIIATKGELAITVPALDISNIFDRKIILRNTDSMTENGIEQFIANNILDNFVNTEDSILNLDYIDVYINTNTLGTVTIDEENGLYNFHTFLINCRQYKNIYTDFSIVVVDGQRRLRIDIGYKLESTMLVDTTLAEVTGYNKVYEVDPVTKVECYIREDNTVYNLYLKSDRTTTTNKDDPDRIFGRIETISCDTSDRAPEESLNVIKSNRFKHLVEFSIAKTSKLIDVTELYVGRTIQIKTEDSIYDSYISAITLTDENFVKFKSGNLRIDFTDKQRQAKREGTAGNKVDVSGGIITGGLKVIGPLQNSIGEIHGEEILYNNTSGSTGTITLSKTAANYKYIDIYTKDDNNIYSYVRVYEPNNKEAMLTGVWLNNDAANLKHTIVKISNNKIIPQKFADTRILIPYIDYNITNYIKIVRVCGIN